MEIEVITREPTADVRPTPLLFVHGAWGGAWQWDEYFLPYFAGKGYTVHALSLRGHGASEGRVFGARIRDYLADVVQVAAGLPTPPVMIGHSMGGYIVQKYLETHAAPAGVLVASATPNNNLPMMLRIMRMMPGPMLRGSLTFQTRPLVSTPERVRAALFSADLADDRLMRYFERFSDESMLAMLGIMGLEPVRPRQITTPLLVLGAEHDALISADQFAHTARTYGTDVVMIPDVAHGIQLEDNWQVAADAIAAWLAERGL
jgi:pimeloyl-ACP methyl ester carboxylesterase